MANTGLQTSPGQVAQAMATALGLVSSAAVKLEQGFNTVTMAAATAVMALKALATAAQQQQVQTAAPPVATPVIPTAKEVPFAKAPTRLDNPKGDSKAIAALDAAFVGATAAAGGLTAAFNATVGVADTLRGALAPFTQLVQQFDPGLVIRFNMALEDLQASLGKIFEPVIDAGVQFADFLNETFTELAPILTPVVKQVASLLKELAEVYVNALAPIVDALVPVVSAVTEALRPLNAVVGETVAQFARLAAEIIQLLGPLLENVLPKLVEGLTLLHTVVNDVVAHMRAAIATLKHVIDNWNVAGAWSPAAIQRAFTDALAAARAPALRRTPPGSRPRTNAARSAQVTDIESIGRNARVAAFGARSPEERTATATEWMVRWFGSRTTSARDPAEAAAAGVNSDGPTSGRGGSGFWSFF